MTLNDRERFILHTMSVMVVDSMVKKFRHNSESLDDIIPLTPENLIDTMHKIGKGRCRKLSVNDISELYEEISEEMLLGTEMHKDNI
jgi:hypothetical protein|tara:strand:+ start:1950 stop:2210 length:261 start_codon:yes stop_codon:yes gene_type:complete